MHSLINHRPLVAAALVAGLCVTHAAFAVDAVTIQDFDGGASTIAPGATLTRTGASGNAGAFSTNPALDGSAWAHTGKWWTFQLLSAATTVVSVTAADPGTFTPGISIWATGASDFDGGTTGFGGEISSALFGTPHSFNATGAMGDSGTLWMAAGHGGNALETLGYASAGASVVSGGWGESLLHGVHDVSLTNSYESGVSGSVGAGFAELVLTDLAAGYYVIFVGGADIAQAGGAFDLAVSAVPVPAGIWLLGSALLACVQLRRRR